MTDIVLPDQQPAPGVDLELWARQATAAAVYAEGVCSTTMAPAAYRGKPAEAAAAILAGAELGFSPMASLRAFDNIQGTPAPKAMTLRAVVQAAGHEVRIVESTPERAVVDGRRKGDTEWQTSIWTIDRAQAMPQFKTNPNYKSNPAAMLVARATAEVCRWIASDAIMGMPYAAEEIQDERIIDAPPATRRLTAAELTGPVTDEDRRAVFHQIEKPPALEPVTREQQKHLFALWRDLGLDGDDNRARRLAGTAEILGLAALDTFNDLTREQADQAITALIERMNATDQ